MRQYFSFLILPLFFLILSAMPALALEPSPITQLNPFAETVRDGTENMFYGLAAMGMIAAGVLGFFGRFAWSWIFTAIGGMAFVAAMPAVIGFIAGFFA